MTSARTGAPPTDGWVYILSNAAWPGYVKVGAARDLKDRLRDYQTASPFRDFVVEDATRADDRLAFERQFHDAMKGHRVGSTEWFHVNPRDARNILNHLKKGLP